MVASVSAILIPSQLSAMFAESSDPLSYVRYVANGCEADEYPPEDAASLEAALATSDCKLTNAVEELRRYRFALADNVASKFHVSPSKSSSVAIRRYRALLDW